MTPSALFSTASASAWKRAAFALCLLLIASGPASAQYFNPMNPTQKFANPAAATLDMIRTQSLQQAMRRAYGGGRLPQGDKAPAQAGVAARTAPAIAVATSTPRHPVSATDFRPTGQRDTADVMVASAPITPAERTQLRAALKQVQRTVEAMGDFRRNNLAYATALLIGASLQVWSGKPLDDAQTLGLVRIVNDDLIDAGGFARLDDEQRTRAYDTMLLTGGLIAGMAENAQATGNTQMAAQAKTMAGDALKTFGLL